MCMCMCVCSCNIHVCTGVCYIPVCGVYMCRHGIYMCVCMSVLYTCVWCIHVCGIHMYVCVVYTCMCMLFKYTACAYHVGSQDLSYVPLLVSLGHLWWANVLPVYALDPTSWGNCED